MSSDLLTVVESSSEATITGSPRQMRQSAEPNTPPAAPALHRTTPAVGPRATNGLSERARGVTVWALALLLVLFLAIPVGALVVRALGAGNAWDARTYDTLRKALGLSMATTAVDDDDRDRLGNAAGLPPGTAPFPGRPCR